VVKILIVDDSCMVRYRIKELFRKVGQNWVIEAGDGVQAVNKFKEHLPELVTMDITMPKMDGIVAMKKILEIEPKTKIIMISALGQKFTVLEAIRSGAVHFIVKPFDNEKVIRVINEVIRLEIDSTNGEQKKNIENNARTDKEIKAAGNNLEVRESPCEKLSFENVCGTFIIKIHDDACIDEANGYNMIMKGIIHVKPLNVVFEFGVLDYIDSDFMKVVSCSIEDIISVGGKYKLSSRNERFKAYVKTLNLDNLNEFSEFY
jgi:two-component system, chemotaxis family, chemotaxis protein CheY